MPPSKYISESIKGKLLPDEEGHYLMKTKFMPESPEMEIPIEELLEDFENENIEINIYKKNTDPPIYGQTSWEKCPDDTPDADYNYASKEAYEKFLDMKFGMMIHFGLYSHLGLLESWSVHNQNAPKWFQEVYYTMWQVFNPVQFDATEWADLAKRAGMQFFQCTTKHHEGFCLFDTKTKTKALKRIGSLAGPGVQPIEEVEINFSTMDSPFKRDIIGELIDAFRKRDLGIGLYFSHIDWNDPNFRWDPANRSYDPKFTPESNPEEWAAFIERERQQLVELFSNYGPLDQIFFDGTWFGLAWEDMKKIIKEIRELQPHCMLSDRGIGIYGDFTSPERWIPSDIGDTRMQGRPKVWQVCDPIGTHWSWVPEEKYKDKHVLLRNLIDAVAKGGTYVFDVNPTNTGTYPTETVQILEYMGEWLRVNGEAIYNTRRWETKYSEPDQENIYYTRSKDKKAVYLIHLGWPYEKVVVKDIVPKPDAEITLLGVQNANLSWEAKDGVLKIHLPPELNKKIPCDHAFCFKIPLA